MVSTMPSLFILIVTITYTFLINRSAHLLPHTPVWPGQCIHTSGNFVCLIPTVKYGHFELYATDWEPVTRLLWWCQCGTSQPIVITTTSILMLDVVDIQVLLRSASLPLILAEKPNLICLNFHARCCRHQVSTLLSDKTSPVLAEKPLASTKE